jgi:hypothetical protein
MTMKIRDIKKFIANLPDSMDFCEESYDGSHLVIEKEQLRVDGGHLLFTPAEVYVGVEAE